MDAIYVCGFAAVVDADKDDIYRFNEHELKKMHLRQPLSCKLFYQHDTDCHIGYVLIFIPTDKGLFCVSSISSATFLSVINKVASIYTFNADVGDDINKKKLCLLKKIAPQYSLTVLRDRSKIDSEDYVEELSIVGLGARRQTSVTYFLDLSKITHLMKQYGIYLTKEIMRYIQELQSIVANGIPVTDFIEDHEVTVKILCGVLRHSQHKGRSSILRQDSKPFKLDDTYLVAEMESQDNSVPMPVVTNLLQILTKAILPEKLHHESAQEEPMCSTQKKITSNLSTSSSSVNNADRMNSFEGNSNRPTSYYDPTRSMQGHTAHQNPVGMPNFNPYGQSVGNMALSAHPPGQVPYTQHPSYNFMMHTAPYLQTGANAPPSPWFNYAPPNFVHSTDATNQANSNEHRALDKVAKLLEEKINQIGGNESRPEAEPISNMYNKRIGELTHTVNSLVKRIDGLDDDSPKSKRQKVKHYCEYDNAHESDWIRNPSLLTDRIQRIVDAAMNSKHHSGIAHGDGRSNLAQKPLSSYAESQVPTEQKNGASKTPATQSTTEHDTGDFLQQKTKQCVAPSSNINKSEVIKACMPMSSIAEDDRVSLKQWHKELTDQIERDKDI